MCVYSQAHRSSAIHPPCTARWNPSRRPPIDRVQVERPRPPSGASPVFHVQSPHVAGVRRHAGPGGGVLRPRPDAAGRRIGPGVLGRPQGRGDDEPLDPRRGPALRAVQPHRRDVAVDGDRPPGRQLRQGSLPGGDAGGRRGRRRRPRGDWSSRSPDRSSSSTGPPAGRSCWRRRRRTTSSSRWPSGWSSTTWWPPATASTPTEPTTARSPAPSCGPTASSPRSRRGPTSTASISPRATPTRTASTTRRCSVPSARRSW